MTLDPTISINAQLEGLGTTLANNVIASLAWRLPPSPDSKRIINEILRPVIEAMGSNIIQPALLGNLLEKYKSKAANHAKKARDTTTELLGVHLADAILPDLQKPGVLENEAAFKAELRDIAEGLSMASKEDIMSVLREHMQEALSPIRLFNQGRLLATPKAPVKPSSIAPDNRNRILGMISGIEIISDDHIRLIFDHQKIKPEDYENAHTTCLSTNFSDAVNAIVEDIIGCPIERRARGQHKNDLDSFIQYDASPLLEYFDINDLRARIDQAIQQSKAAQGRSLA